MIVLVIKNNLNTKSHDNVSLKRKKNQFCLKLITIYLNLVATKWIWSHHQIELNFKLIKLIKCINYVIHENLDDILVYVDDNFIFPRNFKGHNQYV
jgi:hypothetical protein